MADLVDRAQEQETYLRGQALQARKPEAPKNAKACLWCGTATAGRRWCDAACRDDWERELGR